MSIQKLVMAILAITGLCVVAQLYIPIPIMGLFAKNFNISIHQALWITSAFGFAYAVGFLVFGPLSDKYGRKNLLVFGLFGLSISTFLVSLSSSFDMIIGLRALQGFIAATFAPTALSYINEKIDIHIRATSIALMTCGFMLAGIAGQLYAESISYYWSWQAIFWTLSIVYFILGVVALWLLEKTDKAKEIEKLLTIYNHMIKHLRSRTLLPLYIISFFLLFAFVAIYSIFGNYLVTTYHLNSTELFYVRSAAIPGMLVALFIGKYIRQYGARKIIFFGLCFVIIGILGMAMFNNLIVLVAFSIVFVSGVAITAPSVIAEIGQSAQIAKGAAISLYTFILFVGASLGPVFSHEFTSFFVLCLTLSGCLLLSLIIKETV